MRKEALHLYQELLEDSYTTVKTANILRKVFGRISTPAGKGGIKGDPHSHIPDATASQWRSNFIDKHDALVNANARKNTGLLLAGGALPATGLYAYGKGREKGEEEASSNKMLTFGGGMAAGAAVPKALELAQNYARQYAAPQHADPFQRF